MTSLLGTGRTPRMALRGRRLRRTPGLRRLVRETRLHPDMFVQPLFIGAGVTGRQPIAAMPGQDRLGLDALAGEAARLQAAGVKAVLLFGLPAAKDGIGSGAWADDGIVQEGIRAL